MIQAMTPEDADRLIAAFTAWTDAQPTCRALAIAGSWARGAARPDSDLDLIVLTDDLPRWTTGPDWLETLDPWPDGLVFTDAVLETHGVARSWRIWLGGAELELTFVDMNWADIAPVDPGTRRVVSAGLRILIDRNGLLDALTRALAED